MVPEKFDDVKFSVTETGSIVIVETNAVKFFINKNKGKPLFVEIKESGGKIKCDNKGNLKGVLAEHLTEHSAKYTLQNGLVTKNGVYVLMTAVRF